MDDTKVANLSEATAEDLEAELKRRKAEKLPQDLQRVADLATEIATYHGKSTRQVLEETTKYLAKKR